MHHKWMVLFSTLVLFSLLIAPVGTAQAQDISPDCPSYEPGLLREKEVLRSLPVECVEAYKDAARQAGSGASGQDVGPMTVGGPDGFGYTYNDSVAYNWISATQNSGLIGYEEFSSPIDIGFNFPFYGVPQSKLYVSTMGLITFNSEGIGSGTYLSSVPDELNPNNLIAPYSDYLVVGSPYNSGAIYYSQGGIAPNRYFVVEWRQVELDSVSPIPFSFEAILYENGEILFQYQSLPEDIWPLVGIEDSVGSQGLGYDPYALSPLKAIRFYYPNTPTARLSTSPIVQAGAFAATNGHKDFPITVINPGTLGADTYDLTVSSTWSVTLLASDRVTPLTDTDGDSLIDTGSLPQGTSTTLIARVTTPNGAQVGDDNTAAVTITSSLNASKTKTINLFTSIPANFASVLQDEANGAMSFMTIDSSGISTSKATANDYFGDEIAMLKLSNNQYFYAWHNHHFDGNSWADDIEYAILGPTGNLIHPVTQLTNNSGAAMYTSDRFPAVAVAPDGTIGIIWRRYLSDSSINKFKYDIYFATLNASGNVLTGPTNITNNSVWSASGDLNVRRFESLAIAASDDNRFVIGWNETRNLGFGVYDRDVWYAIRNTAGENIFSPYLFTQADHRNYGPTLNSLTGGKVIMTWVSSTYSGQPRYLIINSNGTGVSLPYFDFNYYSSTVPDAVQLPNGKVAIAWPTYGGVQFVTLNSSFLPEGGSSAVAQNTTYGDGLSVTTDASSHIIMTWADGYAQNNLFYALGDGNTGAFITPPMPYKTSGSYVELSINGQGNAPYDPLTIAHIRGNTGVGEVTLRYTDGISQSVTSDTNGNYSINVPVGWSGTVTPSKAGYAFTPSNRIYTNIQADQTDQNYTAEARSSADTTGVFRPSNGLLYLKNHNTTGFADVAINYGLGGDYPVVGDWDGDGDATIGIYRNGKFYLRNENTLGFADMVFAFGVPGDQPIAGDWDGDGMDTIGVYRPSAGLFLLRNSNDAGSAQMSFYLGNYGDVGIAGDWDGDGKDTTGVFRPSNGYLFLKNTNATGYADMALNYGLPGDMPVTGDWDGNGTATIGIYRNGTFFLRNSNTIGFADLVFSLGNPGDMPIAGDWDGIP